MSSGKAVTKLSDKKNFSIARARLASELRANYRSGYFSFAA